MAKGLQSRDGAEMAGLEGRTQLLIRLADALEGNKDFFGADGRPGNMLGESHFPSGCASVARDEAGMN